MSGLPPLMQILENFANVSGLRLNVNKSIIYPLFPNSDKYLHLLVPTHIPIMPITFRYLGMYVYHTPEETKDGNLTRSISGLRVFSVFWGRLPLSPLGRLALSKMIELPRLLYFISTVPVLVPKKVFTELNSWLADLIWGSARHRAALATLFGLLTLAVLRLLTTSPTI